MGLDRETWELIRRERSERLRKEIKLRGVRWNEFPEQALQAAGGDALGALTLVLELLYPTKTKTVSG